MPVLVRLTHTNSPMTADPAKTTHGTRRTSRASRCSPTLHAHATSAYRVKHIIHACQTRPLAHSTKHKQRTHSATSIAITRSNHPELTATDVDRRTARPSAHRSCRPTRTRTLTLRKAVGRDGKEEIYFLRVGHEMNDMPWSGGALRAQESAWA
ncbi:uncharacterized protein LAESUDRAFT_551061 [Laetiporus sulphureus 93-53]|uniref:Uncharacterized protein n=1 Tax=Laetiporus sulphureus 93-53 TaxID=1314785 RepID=A0A165FSW9_9APHY|nr:uncharacterized protein LAESUDRAFT_551061 [Laetiporus sulphureus 93-53]KZT09371.1 hypothetical protein LAESUDRAFT_551061 [Laetiporus sulphureus 93-53]